MKNVPFVCEERCFTKESHAGIEFQFRERKTGENFVCLANHETDSPECKKSTEYHTKKTFLCMHMYYGRWNANMEQLASHIN